MKRIISVILSLVLISSLIPSAFATSNEATQAAQTLYELGLFNGTGTDANGTPIFDLDRAPTRHEAVTMLVRLLGKGEEAESGTWETPFTDVTDWAQPYVGYAYTNGLTAGTSATTYGGNETVTASQYLTFVLRALGYTSGTDFQWDRAWELSDSLGITSGQYNANVTNFTRGDVAIISNNALSAKTKTSAKTLLESVGSHNLIRHIPTSDDLREIGSIWPHYICINGSYYLYGRTTGLTAYQFNGEIYCPIVYLSYPDGDNAVYSHLGEFIELATSSYNISPTDNPYLSGAIHTDVNASYDIKLTNTIYYGAINFYSTWEVGYRGIVLSSPEAPTSGKFLLNDSIRTYGEKNSKNSNITYYVNLHDVLKYFGIDGHFYYSDTAEDNQLGLEKVLTFTS